MYVGPLAHADDHGDDRASATRVALPSETSGEIDPGGDEDWFRFEVAASGDVVVETSGVLDTIGALHDANGDALVVDDDSGGAFNFSIQRTLEAGTYYVRVTSFESNTGGYVLHLRTGAPDDDHGDTLASATQVALPSETAGEIDPGGDWDFFRFEVAADGGEVTAETTGDDLDTVGFLFDADGNLLASNDDADPGSDLNFRIRQTLDAGTYYVLVVSFGGAVGSYVLSMRRGEAEEDAHGDSLATATRVALPSRTAGAIGAGDDKDWFRFEVPVAGVVTASTLGGLDTLGGLYDANGTLLASNNDAVDNFGNFRIRHAVGAGTHYVRVWSGFQETGSYVLDLRQEGSDDDHGNSAADATAVALPGNVSGHIDPAGDADWFRFEAARAGALTVRARVAGGDLRFLLVLAEWSYSGPTEVDWELSIEAGVHYLEVKHDGLSYNDGTGDYTIELLFDGVGAPTTTEPATADPANAAAGHLRNLGDFNGDGRDDVLLRHADGRWRYYPMDGATVLAGNGAANLTRDLAWRIAGIGDFDGDGKDDVLLRKTDGRWFFYPMDGRNVLAGRGTVRMTRDLAWQVAGIGDLDGDGKDDVLMRHADGRWHYYRMNGRRPLAGSGSGRLTRDLDWQMAGVGDFDGDGKDDVLLRRRDDGRWYFYPMNGRASIAGRGTVPLTRDLAWAVAGVGDFDADGRHDVLLRHTDGRWRYYPLQGRRVLDGAGLVNLTDDTTTTVAGIGDLNYDGCADVLARLADGGWQYYALDGRRVLPASGEAALSGDLAWGALSTGGVATGVAPTLSATLADRSATLGQDETIDLAKAFVDDQQLAYEARSSDAGVVRASVDGDALTLTPVAAGTATVTVTARDPDGNTATQTFTVTVAESDGTDTGGGSAGDTFRDCAECPLMVRIPAGTFTMGSPESEPGCCPYDNDGERPQHTVSIPAFAAGVHEVTFAEWDACVGAGGCESYNSPFNATGGKNDGGWGRDDRPAINVHWDEAQEYVDWLSRTTGQHYRLLTESEWEYAARAGTTTPFHTGETITPQQANFDGRRDYPANDWIEDGLYRGQTVPVGSFAPNAFGLYDMHGNVWEWVQDCYGSYENAPNDGSALRDDDCRVRVQRGGAWNENPAQLRSAERGPHDISVSPGSDTGFRVARTL